MTLAALTLFGMGFFFHLMVRSYAISWRCVSCGGAALLVCLLQAYLPHIPSTPPYSNSALSSQPSALSPQPLLFTTCTLSLGLSLRLYTHTQALSLSRPLRSAIENTAPFTIEKLEPSGGSGSRFLYSSSPSHSNFRAPICRFCALYLLSSVHVHICLTDFRAHGSKELESWDRSGSGLGMRE